MTPRFNSGTVAIVALFAAQLFADVASAAAPSSGLLERSEQTDGALAPSKTTCREAAPTQVALGARPFTRAGIVRTGSGLRNAPGPSTDAAADRADQIGGGGGFFLVTWYFSDPEFTTVIGRCQTASPCTAAYCEGGMSPYRVSEGQSCQEPEPEPKPCIGKRCEP